MSEPPLAGGDMANLILMDDIEDSRAFLIIDGAEFFNHRRRYIQAPGLQYQGYDSKSRQEIMGSIFRGFPQSVMRWKVAVRGP